jgi:hypothetical protein
VEYGEGWMGSVKVPERVALTLLVAAGLLYRAYPHLLLIPRWIIEESYNYQTVRDLVLWGASAQAGFYPMLEHQVIYWAWLLTHISPITLSQYANPLFGALTVVPLYYVLRYGLPVNQSLLGCGLWAFSEAAFYRAAYFGSTEALGFLFALSALAAYQRRNYVLVVPLLLLGAFSHLLPTAFISGVVFTDFFLKAKPKQRILIVAVGLVAVGVFFSPLNPHQRLLSSINADAIIGGFGTFSIYSLVEVLGGATLFGGFIVLGLAAAYGWIQAPRGGLMMIYLILAAAMFIFSWVDYQPNIFAPPRLTFYFVVPFIYYAARWVKLRHVAGICVVAVAASIVGTPTMLYTQNTLNLSEFDFVDSISVPVSDVSEWWTDYPLRVALTSRINHLPMVQLNVTKVEAMSWDYLDPWSTMRGDTGFRYVLLSPRMQAQGLFFVFNGERTLQVRKPVEDIWCSGLNGWVLVKEVDGIKLYERK